MQNLFQQCDEDLLTNIQVTQEEKQAIERICNLGFSKKSCLEAYIICDKDENLAVNYLLENQCIKEIIPENNYMNQINCQDIMEESQFIYSSTGGGSDTSEEEKENKKEYY
ncbi:UBA-like protein [Pseudocohnilembus persalinus]|uniref:UV excision repair protein RAD23 n=1 Tax=Pseudocohnilembus persalinus TaxID=266149 RepID=A0A0V0QGN3_PSEPJ|nr:UBA-like protein [Pseudocohnilembus persalinus]|eukprot:KRX01359.1 UBA-like protein [Pseudocohnilembus persalinus]